MVAVPTEKTRMITKNEVQHYLTMVRLEASSGLDIPTKFAPTHRAEARAVLGKPRAYKTTYLLQDLERLERSWVRRLFI
jgi:hypothetical protein